MRINLERGDQRLLIGGGIALLLIVAATAYLSPPEDEPVFFPSSYSAASGGAKAAYLLLEEMGYNVERWSYSPQELPHPNHGDTLVLANPFMGASQAERDAISAWLEGGGRLLLTGSVGESFLPQRHPLRVLGRSVAARRCGPLAARPHAYPTRIPEEACAR